MSVFEWGVVICGGFFVFGFFAKVLARLVSKDIIKYLFKKGK